MQTISQCEVRLNETERVAYRAFNDNLDAGLTIDQARAKVRDFWQHVLPGKVLSDEFWAWLGR